MGLLQLLPDIQPMNGLQSLLVLSRVFIFIRNSGSVVLRGDMGKMECLQLESCPVYQVCRLFHPQLRAAADLGKKGSMFP